MKYETIFIEKAFYKNEKRLLLKFGYDQELIKLTKQLSGAKWSKTLNAWHIADTKENFNSIYLLFKGKAWLNWDALKNANEKREHIEATRTKEKIKNPAEKLDILNEEGTKKIEQFKFWLRSKRYSESTIDTYTNALKTFLRFYNKKDISEITNEDVILFNNEYILANEFSSTFQNQVVNAIKLFFRTMEHTNINADLIHRPKRAFVLPNVLSKEEVKLLLNSLSNLKHKSMLSLIYSCGLRRSELLNLKLTDIDSKRNLVIIRQSKGRKDRIAPLSLKMLELLRSYFVAYKPKYWLFEGQDRNSRYDERSLASVLKQAVEKSKINKPITLHWLRHSYATHLLESGTDLRYIQEILGHSRSTTTEIYTHVSNKSIQKIVSPFDNM